MATIQEAEAGFEIPASISVNVNGANILMPGKPSAKGNTWYEARQEGVLTDPQAAEQALRSMVCSFNGEVINAGEVHVSEVKFRKDGSRRGGGNLTVTHAASIGLGDKGEARYLLKVTATAVERKRNGQTVPVVVVSAACIPQVTRQFSPVGEVDGNLTFG